MRWYIGIVWPVSVALAWISGHVYGQRNEVRRVVREIMEESDANSR